MSDRGKCLSLKSTMPSVTLNITSEVTEHHVKLHKQACRSSKVSSYFQHCWPYGHHRLCHGGEHSIGHFKANKVRLPEKSSDDDFVVDYCSTTTAAANTAAGGIVPDSSSSSLPPLPTQTSAYFPTAFSESDIDRTGDEQATFVLMQHHAG